MGGNMKLNDFRIGTRLNAAFGLILVLMILLASVATYSLREMKRDVNNVAENGRKIEFANNVRDNIQRVNSAVMTVALVNDEKTRAEQKKLLENARNGYIAFIENMAKSAQTKEMKELIAKLQETTAEATKEHNKVIDLAESDLQDLAMSAYMGSQGTSNTLVQLCDRIVELQAKQNELFKAGAERTYVRVLTVVGALSAAIIFIAILTAVLLTRSIVVPLQKGVHAANMLAEGDLTGDLESSGKDELSLLLTAIKNTSGSLRKVVAEVKNHADSLASAGMHLSAGSEQMSRSAEEQANRTSQASAASEEMTQTVMDVARNTSAIAISATAATDAARRGGDMVDKTVQEIHAIAEVAGESSRIVTLLGDKSKQIGNIVGVISDIADQTNLLALNAAIEAARAGDQGRGFAVVADEVRKLAEKTGEATREIETTIKAIRAEVERAIHAMAETAAKVDAGVTLAGESGGAINTVVAGVSDLQGMIQQIASATEEMSTTSDEMAKDIEYIANSTKENRTTVEQATLAAVEMSKLAIELQKIVRGFTV
jgi:methyl-accepting chemotaxis protein